MNYKMHVQQLLPSWRTRIIALDVSVADQKHEMKKYCLDFLSNFLYIEISKATTPLTLKSRWFEPLSGHINFADIYL